MGSKEADMYQGAVSALLSSVVIIGIVVNITSKEVDMYQGAVSASLSSVVIRCHRCHRCHHCYHCHHCHHYQGGGHLLGCGECKHCHRLNVKSYHSFSLLCL